MIQNYLKHKTFDGKSINETTTGMFLNWIYRKTSEKANSCCWFEKIFNIQRCLPAIKSQCALLMLLLATGGCQALPPKPTGYTPGIGTMLVVPMEAPPLEVIPDLIETRIPVYRQYQFQSLPLSVMLEKKIYRSPGGVLIAGYVSEDDSVAPADDLHPVADSSGTAPLEESWSPSLALAQEAVSQLNAGRVKTVISQTYNRLPMAKENRNANLGHWHDAVRQWYGQDKSAVDYRQREPMNRVDAVVEVGIGAYRIFDVQTSLMVLLKLIDPDTGQVIGKAKAKSFSAEDSAQALLSPDGANFKQLVQKIGAQLITQGLDDLGLSPSLSGQNLSAVQTEINY
ncbi:MAG: hypothetical protein PHY16_04970 [Methylobacter sp.]|nr:hypothetical protein [Methylobacter sp.]